jgi:hypothetical protein
MAVMMAMAAMATKDHVSQGQDTKQTQHCDVPPFRSFRMYQLFGTGKSYDTWINKNRICSEKYGGLFLQ